MELGIALYHHLIKDINTIEKYLELASKYNTKIIFTNLINQNLDEHGLKKFKKITSLAKQYNMSVYCDVIPATLKDLKLTDPQAIVNFFNKLGLDGIRYDESENINLIAAMTKNKLNFKQIINASTPYQELDQLIEAGAMAENILYGYNFYPLPYSAPDLNYFQQCLAKAKKYKVKFQVFLASQALNVKGPWLFTDSTIPTLECHRYLTVDKQWNHFLALGVDQAIFAGQFVPESEFRLLAKQSTSKIIFNINHLSSELTAAEKTIIYDPEIHFVRQDLAAFIIRSTMSRIKYKALIIKPRKIKKEWLEKGDIVITNQNSKNYQGEIHLILKCVPVTNYYNYVGKLSSFSSDFLIPILKPRQKFLFKK